MKNILLYFSAFVPMYSLLVVKFLFGFLSQNISLDAVTITASTTYLILVILGIIGFCWNVFGQKEKAKTIIIVESQNITDQHFLGYFSLFVLFALPYELAQLSMFIVSLLIILFIGIVYINSQMYYINPLLNILGYNFYTITYKLNANDSQQYTAKMFYKGKLNTSTNKTYRAKIKNVHFSFLTKC